MSRQSFSLHFLSNQKKQELQDMFDTFDKDHDDKISSIELRNMLGSTGFDEAQVNSLLSKIHTDSEGYISFNDFAKFMKPTLRTPLRLTSKQQELLETFKAFDKNGDGVINAKELTAMMHQLGDRITMEEAKQLISDVDEDNDGVINFDEFARHFGVQPPSSPSTARASRDSRGSIEIPPCNHSHHRFSVRRFFCKQPH